MGLLTAHGLEASYNLVPNKSENHFLLRRHYFGEIACVLHMALYIGH